jgi:hypothetical protein
MNIYIVNKQIYNNITCFATDDAVRIVNWFI